MDSERGLEQGVRKEDTNTRKAQVLDTGEDTALSMPQVSNRMPSVRSGSAPHPQKGHMHIARDKESRNRATNPGFRLQLKK